MGATGLGYVALPAALEVLRHEVREFLAEAEFEPRVDAWICSFDRDFSRRLGRRGWIGMTWPARYGGHELTAFERFVVNEELLAAGAPVAAHWLADRQIGPGILRYGPEGLRARYLPRIAAGQMVFAAGLSEPDAGSDLASVRTRADRVEDGWRLTGRKIWTSWAHRADAILVLARTAARTEERHQGLSQLLVELPSRGTEIRPIPGMDGAEHFNEVIFDGVFVPDTHVLGTAGQGWQQVTGELALERSGSERFLSNLVLLAAYAARKPDTRVVSAAVSRLRLLRQASLAVADLLDRGERPEVAAALVKDLGTAFEQDVVDELVAHVDGQPDPTSEDPVRRLLAQAVLRAPTSTLRGGSTDILRGMVARGLGVR